MHFFFDTLCTHVCVLKYSMGADKPVSAPATHIWCVFEGQGAKVEAISRRAV